LCRRRCRITGTVAIAIDESLTVAIDITVAIDESLTGTVAITIDESLTGIVAESPVAAAATVAARV